MNELDEYLKKCNLVFTNTNNRFDFCRLDFDLDKVEVNYDNCISLFELVSSFNKLYILFKKEYEQLEKMNLGRKIKIISFEKFSLGDKDYRNLILYIDEPIITDRTDTILYLREINGKMKPFVTNCLFYTDKKEYYDNIDLDETIAKKYLDLFEKYSLLIDTYNDLKNKKVFGDGTFSMYIVIDEYNGDLLEGINKIKISLGCSYLNGGYFINLAINLGENFGIDYDNCKFYLDNENVSIAAEEYEKIFNKVYVNKEYTTKK